MSNNIGVNTGVVVNILQIIWLIGSMSKASKSIFLVHQQMDREWNIPLWKTWLVVDVMDMTWLG